jgi:serine/threonine protein kinase
MGCFTKKNPPVKICPVCSFDESEADESMHKLPLRTILHGKYLLGKLLGEGGFGITYLGWDLNLDLKVAVKEYYPTGFVHRETSTTVHPFTGTQGEYFHKGRDKFIKEAKSLAKFFNLPGIVLVKDYFEENGTAYIVMEFIDGLTLKKYLAQSGTNFPSAQIFDLMKPVMSSLAEVHKTGLIHRDISPDNIMINTEGRLKLLDFGAARDYTDSGNKSQSVLIKPGYAPEEQYRAKGKQGPWTDVYALCATIYKCITGVTPDEAIERVRGDEVEPPSKLGVAIAPNQETALMKGLAVYHEDRFQSVQELYDSFYTVLAEIVSIPAAKPDFKQEAKPETVSRPKPEPLRKPKLIPMLMSGLKSKPKPIREPKPKRIPKSGRKSKLLHKPGIIAGIGAALVAVALIVLIISPWSSNGDIETPPPSGFIDNSPPPLPESPPPDLPPTIADLYTETLNLGQMNSRLFQEGWGGWFAGTIYDKAGNELTSPFTSDDFKNSRYLIIDLTNFRNNEDEVESIDLTWRGDNIFHFYWDDDDSRTTKGIAVNDGITVIDMATLSGYGLYLQCDNLLIQLRLNFEGGSYDDSFTVSNMYFAKSADPNEVFIPEPTGLFVTVNGQFDRVYTLGEFDLGDERSGFGLWGGHSGTGRSVNDFTNSQFLILEFDYEPAVGTTLTWSTDWLGSRYTHTDTLPLNTGERAVSRLDNTLIINMRVLANHEHYMAAEDLIDLAIHPYPESLTDAYFADRLNPPILSIDDFGRNVTLGGFNDISEWGKGWHVRSRSEINRIKESRFFIVEFDGTPPSAYGRFHWDGDYDGTWGDGPYMPFTMRCFIVYENYHIINLPEIIRYEDFLRVRNHLLLQYSSDVPDAIDSYFANYIGRR